VLALGSSVGCLSGLQEGIVDTPLQDCKTKKLGFKALPRADEFIRFPYDGMAHSASIKGNGLPSSMLPVYPFWPFC